MIRRALSRLVGWLAKGIGEVDSDAMGVPIVAPLPPLSKSVARRLAEMGGRS